MFSFDQYFGVHLIHLFIVMGIACCSVFSTHMDMQLHMQTNGEKLRNKLPYAPAAFQVSNIWDEKKKHIVPYLIQINERERSEGKKNYIHNAMSYDMGKNPLSFRLQPWNDSYELWFDKMKCAWNERKTKTNVAQKQQQKTEKVKDEHK